MAEIEPSRGGSESRIQHAERVRLGCRAGSGVVDRRCARGRASLVRLRREASDPFSLHHADASSCSGRHDSDPHDGRPRRYSCRIAASRTNDVERGPRRRRGTELRGPRRRYSSSTRPGERCAAPSPPTQTLGSCHRSFRGSGRDWRLSTFRNLEEATHTSCLCIEGGWRRRAGGAGHRSACSHSRGPGVDHVPVCVPWTKAAFTLL